VIAGQIVAALLESDDFDPKDYAMSNLSVLGILEQAGFKPVTDATNTFYRYFPIYRQVTYGGNKRVTALLVTATWHPPKDTEDELERILGNGMIHLTWQFVMQPNGWEAGLPVGRRMAFYKYEATESMSVRTLQKALRVINNVIGNAQGVLQNMVGDSYHAAIKSGLSALGDVINA
jgi:hypothetical protein